MIPTITLIIQVPEDGGRVVFESITDEYGVHESKLVFGGDVDQTDKYMAQRNAKLDNKQQAQHEPPRQIEPPAKIRVRKIKEPTPDPLDVLDALEAEDVA